MGAHRFLLYEHVWGGLVRHAREMGVDAILAQRRLSEGTRDEELLAFAAQERRILLTSNARDFAPLAAEWFLSGREHWGIIIVPGQTDRGLLIRALTGIIHNSSGDSFKNTFRFIQEFV